MEAHDRVAELIPRLRRYARALASTHMPADQLVRATLERAAQQLSLADAAGDLRVWLFGLMHEAYMRSEASQDAEANGLPAPRPQAGMAPREAFEQAIGALPTLQREIFLLVTLEDMSYEQVATTLNIPIGTVMSRLSRAREKLRLQLLNQARVRIVK
jgi:RNA polymerase sigma factor (sigma-70 family)